MVAVSSPSPPAPEYGAAGSLYFYTDPAGLQGILAPQSWPLGALEPPESGNGGDGRTYWDGVSYTYGAAAHLLASDIRYMNDSAELTFGLAVFREAIDTALRNNRFDSRFNEALQAILQQIDLQHKMIWPFRVFAACFCENGDLLSQWRGYAGGQGGFAIGFSRKALSDHTRGVQIASHGMICDMPAPSELVRVVYRDHARFAESVLEQLSEGVRSGRVMSASNGSLGPTVGYLITRYASQMKDIAFEQEAEWRVIVGTESRRASKTRARGARLVPYMDFLVNARLGPGPEPTIAPRAVERIVVGPCRDPLAQQEAVRMLLERRHQDGNGWNDIAVMPSNATSFIG